MERFDGPVWQAELLPFRAAIVSAPVCWLLLLALLVAAPCWASPAWDRGREAFDRGDYEVAERYLLQVVADHPDYAPGFSLLGRSLLALHRAEEAVAKLEQATRLDTDRIDYQLHLAQARITAGKTGAALLMLADLQPTLEGEKRSWLEAADGLLTRAAWKHSDREQAIAVVEKRVAGPAASAELWTVLGTLEARGSDHEAAWLAFERAFELDQSQTTARHAAHQALQQSRQMGADRGVWLRRSAVSAERGLAIDSDPGLIYLAAQSRLAVGDYAESAEHYRALVATEESSGDQETVAEISELWLGLGQALAGAGREQEAMAAYERAAGLAPPEGPISTKAWRHIALALHRAGDYEQATLAYRRAGLTAEASDLEAAYQAIASDDRQREKCRELEKRMAVILEGAEAIRGTSDWNGIEKRVQERLAPCETYLGED